MGRADDKGVKVLTVNANIKSAHPSEFESKLYLIGGYLNRGGRIGETIVERLRFIVEAGVIDEAHFRFSAVVPTDPAHGTYHPPEPSHKFSQVIHPHRKPRRTRPKEYQRLTLTFQPFPHHSLP